MTVLASVSWGATTVRLKPEASVRSAAMCLSDVAVIKADAAATARLKAVNVGPAPLPGRSRPLGADYVRIRLRQAGFAAGVLTGDSATRCLVTRASQVLSGDRLLETARVFLESTIEPGPGRVVVEPVSHPRDLTLPVGQVALSADPVGAATSGSSRRVMVSVAVDGQPAGKADIALRVRRYANVALAKTSLPAGAALTADQVIYEERDCMGLPPDTLHEGDSLDGLQAVRAIGARTVLTRRIAAEVPVVHAGDAVTIRTGSGGILISAPGVAAENGHIGQVIRVRNTSSSQECRATVVDAKTVEVDL